MRKFLQFLLSLVGVYFAPDNHVVPILRFGRYNRVSGPGFVFAVPLVEQALAPVKKSLHIGEFRFEEILSKDNIPFEVQLTVLFIFEPKLAAKNAAAQLVRGGNTLLETIVHQFANRRLRRLAATFNSEELSNDHVISRVEEGIARYLKHEMSTLGLKPLSVRHGGVMIKEIVAPDNFKRTMLDVKHDEAILEVLRSYPVPELVQLLNQVILANSLKDRSGQFALMMGSSETMNMLPLIGPTSRRP